MKKMVSLSLIAGCFIILSSNGKLNTGEVRYKDNPEFSKCISHLTNGRKHIINASGKIDKEIVIKKCIFYLNGKF